MLKTWVMIIIISNGYKSGVSVSAVSAEFHSAEACRHAVGMLTLEATKKRNSDTVLVIASGCFPKE
jgi:hypothetical protein